MKSTKGLTKSERVAKGECLNCPRKAKTRGVCFSCNGIVQRAIKSGEYSEETAIAVGSILAPQIQGTTKTAKGHAEINRKHERHKKKQTD